MRVMLLGGLVSGPERSIKTGKRLICFACNIKVVKVKLSDVGCGLCCVR